MGVVVARSGDVAELASLCCKQVGGAVLLEHSKAGQHYVGGPLPGPVHAREAHCVVDHPDSSIAVRSNSYDILPFLHCREGLGEGFGACGWHRGGDLAEP